MKRTSRITMGPTSQDSPLVKPARKGERIICLVQEALPDVMMVSTVDCTGRLFQGVLLEASKRNVPHGVNPPGGFQKRLEEDNPRHNPAESEAEPETPPANASLELHFSAVSRRHTYYVDGKVAKPPLNLPRRKPKAGTGKKQISTGDEMLNVRLRARQVLCSQCSSVCNEKGENVREKAKKEKEHRADSEQTKTKKKSGRTELQNKAKKPLTQAKSMPDTNGTTNSPQVSQASMSSLNSDASPTLRAPSGPRALHLATKEASSEAKKEVPKAKVGRPPKSLTKTVATPVIIEPRQKRKAAPSDMKCDLSSSDDSKKKKKLIKKRRRTGTTPKTPGPKARGRSDPLAKGFTLAPMLHRLDTSQLKSSDKKYLMTVSTGESASVANPTGTMSSSAPNADGVPAATPVQCEAANLPANNISGDEPTKAATTQPAANVKGVAAKLIRLAKSAGSHSFRLRKNDTKRIKSSQSSLTSAGEEQPPPPLLDAKVDMPSATTFAVATGGGKAAAMAAAIGGGKAPAMAAAIKKFRLQTKQQKPKPTTSNGKEDKNKMASTASARSTRATSSLEGGDKSSKSGLMRSTSVSLPVSSSAQPTPAVNNLPSTSSSGPVVPPITIGRSLSLVSSMPEPRAASSLSSPSLMTSTSGVTLTPQSLKIRLSSLVKNGRGGVTPNVEYSIVNPASPVDNKSTPESEVPSSVESHKENRAKSRRKRSQDEPASESGVTAPKHIKTTIKLPSSEAENEKKVETLPTIKAPPHPSKLRISIGNKAPQTVLNLGTATPSSSNTAVAGQGPSNEDTERNRVQPFKLTLKSLRNGQYSTTCARAKKSVKKAKKDVQRKHFMHLSSPAHSYLSAMSPSNRVFSPAASPAHLHNLTSPARNFGLPSPARNLSAFSPGRPLSVMSPVYTPRFLSPATSIGSPHPSYIPMLCPSGHKVILRRKKKKKRKKKERTEPELNSQNSSVQQGTKLFINMRDLPGGHKRTALEAKSDTSAGSSRRGSGGDGLDLEESTAPSNDELSDEYLPLATAALAGGHSIVPGDVVWAKSKNNPWWPAKVLNLLDVRRRGAAAAGSPHVQVSWYTDHRITILPCSQIKAFLQNYKAVHKSRKKGIYREAINLATEDVRQRPGSSPLLKAAGIPLPSGAGSGTARPTAAAADRSLPTSSSDAVSSSSSRTTRRTLASRLPKMRM